MKYKEKIRLAWALRRKAWLVSCIIGLLPAYAGIQAQSAVSAAGGDISGTGGSVAYTIGQVAYTNFGGESGSISLGAQQPNLFLTVGTSDLDITLAASVFPNPANSETTLKLEGPDASPVDNDLSLNLYDLNGKLIYQQDILSTVTTIPMDHLTEGVYVIQVTRKNIEIKSFKVFKSN